MREVYEVSRGGFTISDDRRKLPVDAVAALLGRTYWASSPPQEVIVRSIENSICFGLYEGDKLAGFARVVTDFATLVFLCDVCVEESYRGKGLGKWLVESVVAHPELRPVPSWVLATKDAHGLYRKFGWKELSCPDRWMQRKAWQP